MSEQETMLWKIFISIALIICFTSLLAQAKESDCSTIQQIVEDEVNSWKLIKTKSGIQVFARKVSGSDYKEFRGITTLNTPLKNVLHLLDNPLKCAKWLYRCIEEKIIQQVNNSESYRYTIYSAPPLISKKRDAIVHRIQLRCPKNKSLMIQFVGNPDHPYSPKEKGLVRVTKVKGSWVLTRLKENTVKVTYTLYSEPGGSIGPKFSNFGNKKAIFKTLVNLRTLVTNPEQQ